MIVGKKLIGEGAELYLPLALSKLRYMAGNYDGAMRSRTLRIGDASILLELNSADSGQVTITVNSLPTYEFFTTGKELHTSGGLFQGFAVSARVKDGEVVALPVGSTLEEDGEVPPRWDYSADPQYMTLYSPHQHMWQVQGIPEYAYYPGAKSSKVLVSCWSSARDAPNMAGYGGGVNYGGFFTDVHYDDSPCLYSAGREPAGKFGLAPDADWYRRAASRTVTSEEFGSREFIVMTDARSQFVVYPVVPPDNTLYFNPDDPYRDQHIKTNVPVGIAQTLVPAFPTWVESHYFTLDAARDYDDADLARRAIPGYVWKFDSKALRAAAIVFHTLPPADNTDVSEIRPGMVEFDVTIVLTGPNPEDFAAALTLARSIDPTSSPRYPVAVDYAWAHPDMTALDDLIIMEGEVFYPADPDTFVYAPAFNSCYARVGITNESSGERIRNLTIYNNRRGWPSESTEQVLGNDYVPYVKRTDTGQATGVVESTMVLAYDLRILAVALQRRTDTVFVEGAARWSTTTMQLEVYAHNELAETKVLGAGTPAEYDLPSMAAVRYLADRTGTSGNYIGGHGFVNQIVLQAGYPMYDNTIDAEVPTGAMLHNLLFSHLPSVAHEVFTVHPAGHWSIATLPSFYFRAVSDGVPEGASWATAANVELVRAAQNPVSFPQGFIDIVCFKAKSGEAIRTSHIALFNEAYGKALTEEDFKYSFGLADGPSVLSDPGNHAVFLTATRQGKEYRHEIVGALRDGTSISDPGVSFYDGNIYRLAMVDPRRANPNALPDADGLTLDQSYLVASPVLRGSSLFHRGVK